MTGLATGRRRNGLPRAFGYPSPPGVSGMALAMPSARRALGPYQRQDGR
jgi:hypothetical protein